MMGRRCVIFVIAALGCAAVAVAQPTTQRTPSRQQPTSQRNYLDRYGLLEQRNIFLRDRSRPAPTQRSLPSAATQPARRPEQMLVLTGIVIEANGFHAYVEDNSATPPKILRVAPGADLGSGRVIAIDIDAIAYEHAGNSKWINVGSDLTGQPAGLTAFLSGGAATTAPAASGPAPDPNDPNLTVEQRMRLRSLQQRQGR